MTTADTREIIMNTARAMVQAHGYNALSFREVAKVVGIKSASIHYHFPTKGDLGAAIAGRYADDGAAYLDQLFERHADLETCLRHYTEIFRSALVNDNRMCLCGIMSAEHDDLPDEVRVEVSRFNAVNALWLGRLLARAHPETPMEVLEKQAFAIFAAIEGAQLVARGQGDVAVYDQVIATYQQLGLFR